MSMDGHSVDGDAVDGTWKAYSNYNDVSRRVVNSVDKAAEAEAVLRAKHAESSTVKSKEAAELRSYIQAAVNNLLPEIQREAERDREPFGELNQRFVGGDSPAETGYTGKLEEANLRQECPPWVNDLVYDLRTAAWELGYYQAGKEEDDGGYDGDPYDSEVMKMIEGMT